VQLQAHHDLYRQLAIDLVEAPCPRYADRPRPAPPCLVCAWPMPASWASTDAVSLRLPIHQLMAQQTLHLRCDGGQCLPVQVGWEGAHQSASPEPVRAHSLTVCDASRLSIRSGCARREEGAGRRDRVDRPLDAALPSLDPAPQTFWNKSQLRSLSQDA